jgi:hypothetical protein
MFKGKSSEQVAADIRSAQARLQAAQREADRLAQEHGERIGADLAGGGTGGDAAEASLEISGARLRVDGLNAAIGKLQGTLRATIEAEDAKAREGARTTIEACAQADAKLKAELAEVATRAFGLAVQREGRKAGPLIAMRILNGLALGDYGPTMSGWAKLRSSDSEAAKRMIAAVESSGTLPDNAECRQAAQEALGRPLDVDGQVAALLGGAPPAG